MTDDTTPNDENQILEDDTGDLEPSGNGNGFDPKEVREKAKIAHSDRMARIKANLPERTFKMVSGAPPTYQGRLAKAVLGECSLTTAVRAKCEDCVGWEEVQKRVGGCKSYSCALWHWRPYQPKPVAEG